MARFSLRNQNKISKKFGSDFLHIILSELRKEFNTTSEFILYDSTTEYKFIIVGEYEFYVVGRIFDVYNLALKPK